MSPETAVLTTSSSVQGSPEPLRGRGEEQFPPVFQLPDSILSRKTSATSLGQNAAISPGTGAMAEAMGAASSKGSLIRRLSSRASRRITSRRRQSSAAPTSRDGSVGPCFLRRRSDSNATAPPEYPPIATDTDSDLDERDDVSSLRSGFGPDGAARESSANSVTGSITGGSSAMAAPTIPHRLKDGTWLRKVSKKNRAKRICLMYEPNSNKLMWDKSRPLKFLHVDEVKEIRTGSDVQQYGRDFSIPEAERLPWFTIIYAVPEKAKTKYMHLIADDVEICQLWKDTLESMLKHRQEVMASLMSFDDLAVAQYWQSEMLKQSSDLTRTGEEMDITGVKRVCQNLHIYSSQATLEANFELSDSRRRKRLNFAEFLNFVRRMNHRQDVQKVIRNIASRPGAGISLEEFLKFVWTEQGEDVYTNRAAWEKVFIRAIRKSRSEDCERQDTGQGEPQMMSEAAFIGFLTSNQNAPIVQEPQEYELNRPMNEYFISSSHNTYLLGRQVAGQSSIEGYISALVRGCRCVEVDCWDGPDGQPQVVHGRTLTSSISFQEVMTTINKYAFVKSRFPLWISLEVHCNAAQQAIMADIIRESFGSKLVNETLDPESDKLPAPSQLMERILIKVKKPRMKEAATPVEIPARKRGNSLGSPLTKAPAPDNFLTPSQSLPQSPMLSPSLAPRRMVSKTRVDTITEEQVQGLMSSSTSDSESGSETSSLINSANKTTKVLGQLGVYCAGVKFSGFDAAEAKKFNHIFSFMESSFARNSRTKEEKMQLDIHNMRYMMRVYPDGKRIASSNFDPLIYWRRGVQMAALNWQTHDLGMQLNQAMFEGGTDASGYVLKPPELRDIQVLPFNLDLAEGKKERSIVSFTIDVLSAQQLMRPFNLPANKSMDPYVEVEVFHANDKRDKKEESTNLAHQPDTALKFQTDVIRGNGFNPMFNTGPFKFRVTTKHPDFVFVRWSVKLSTDGENYNASRPPIASFTAKLSQLKQGYRTLPLVNHAGDQYLFSTLFCRVSIGPIEKTLIDAPRRIQDTSKLNRLGGKVFGRINTSPRSTMEKSSMEKSSMEKSSFDSSA